MSKAAIMRVLSTRTIISLLASSLLTVGLLAGGPATTACAATTHWRVTVIDPPGGYKVATLAALSCSSATSCVTGGQYTEFMPPEVGGPYLYMLASEAHGKWQPASAGIVPSSTASPVQSFVNSISCPAAGTCVAVGQYYADSANPEQPLIAIEEHGSWVRAFSPAMPANASRPLDASLTSVSCTSAGSCEVIGAYYDKAGDLVPVSIAESGGRWRPGTAISTRGTGSYTDLQSVACSRPGYCAAAGSYLYSQDSNYGAIAAVESGGRWGTVRPVALPKGTLSGQLTSVSCQSATSCVAVGPAQAKGGQVAMMATMSRGTWARAKLLPARPAGAPSGSTSGLDEVSCTRSFCEAVGTYKLKTGVIGWAAMRFAKGKWSGWTRIPLPAYGHPADASTDLGTAPGAISCVSSGSCTVAGTFVDKAGDYQAAVATRS
jgi:hypothetical protein